jgi:CotS family spore coat protein
VECGGLRYTVMNWVEGRELDYGRAGDLETAAALIARLHRATAGFRPESAPKGRIAHGTWLERFRGRLDQLSAFVDEVRGRRTLDSFDQLFLSLAPGGIRAGGEALAVLASSEYRRVAEEARDRGAFCHHDTAHHNFLTGPSGTWIIDFDYLLCDTPLHDVGSLMRRGLKARGWGAGAARAVLSAYAAEGDLPRGWARILRGFLRWPQELWRLSTQRYVEELPWPFARFMSRLEEYAVNLTARERCLAELGDELESFEAEH